MQQKFKCIITYPQKNPQSVVSQSRSCNRMYKTCTKYEKCLNSDQFVFIKQIIAKERHNQ